MVTHSANLRIGNTMVFLVPKLSRLGVCERLAFWGSTSVRLPAKTRIPEDIGATTLERGDPFYKWTMVCLDIDIDASHNSEWMMALTYLVKRVRAAANTSLTRQVMHFLRVLGVYGSWNASAGLFAANPSVKHVSYTNAAMQKPIGVGLRFDCQEKRIVIPKAV